MRTDNESRQYEKSEKPAAPAAKSGNRDSKFQTPWTLEIEQIDTHAVKKIRTARGIVVIQSDSVKEERSTQDGHHSAEIFGLMFSAPALLEALRDCAARIEHMLEIFKEYDEAEQEGSVVCADYDSDILQRARRAIALAENPLPLRGGEENPLRGREEEVNDDSN